MTTPEREELAHIEVVKLNQHPLSIFGLINLYFYPKRYFSNVRDLNQRSAMFIAACLVGIAGAMGRIDKKIIQAELGQASKSWEATSSWLLSSWLNYWVVVIAAGSLSAIFLWYAGGWWYAMRLKWSGATAPSSSIARRVYSFQEFVVAAPTVLIALIQTALFSNYREAWRADELWTSSVVVFVFWSCWTSYAAATTAFQVSKAKARIWFLALPVLLYVLVYGAVGTLYALLANTAT